MCSRLGVSNQHLTLLFHQPVPACQWVGGPSRKRLSSPRCARAGLSVYCIPAERLHVRARSLSLRPAYGQKVCADPADVLRNMLPPIKIALKTVAPQSPSGCFARPGQNNKINFPTLTLVAGA